MDVDALDEIDLYDFESSLRLDWSIMQSAGFDTVGEYRSSISRLRSRPRPCHASCPTDLPDDCAIVSAHNTKMSSQDLLKTIYDISNESFKNNLFYKDIGFAAFKDLYARASVQANDTYVYFAKVGEIYAGFVYAFIDRSKNALIAKTIAVLPQYRRCHLARAMMSVLANDASRALNLDLDLDLNFADPHASPALVHAYFHQDNVSRHLAQAPDTDLADFRILRSYRLFAHDHRQRKTR